MVSKYLKALSLTLFLLGIGLALMAYLDNARFSSITNDLEEISIANEEAQQLLFYESIFGNEDGFCQVLSSIIDKQTVKTSGVLQQFEDAQAQNFLSDTRLLKSKYLNQNIQLYLLSEKYRTECGRKIEPLIYFYTDKSFNPDETAQQKILDEIVSQCRSVRVFAMPHDLGIPVVSVLLAKYNVDSYPALIIANQKFSGIQSKEQINAKVSCW